MHLFVCIFWPTMRMMCNLLALTDMLLIHRFVSGGLTEHIEFSELG